MKLETIFMRLFDKITKLRSKMEESSERTTFFTIKEFLIYH